MSCLITKKGKGEKDPITEKEVKFEDLTEEGVDAGGRRLSVLPDLFFI